MLCFLSLCVCFLPRCRCRYMTKVSYTILFQFFLQSDLIQWCRVLKGKNRLVPIYLRSFNVQCMLWASRMALLNQIYKESMHHASSLSCHPGSAVNFPWLSEQLSKLMVFQAKTKNYLFIMGLSYFYLYLFTKNKHINPLSCLFVNVV